MATARKNGYPLGQVVVQADSDELYAGDHDLLVMITYWATMTVFGGLMEQVAIETDVTNFTLDDLAEQDAVEVGALIHGLFLQGARWDTKTGLLKDSLLKELYASIPIVHVVAVPVHEKKAITIWAITR